MPHLGGPHISDLEILMNRVQFLGDHIWTCEDVPIEIAGALPVNGSITELKINIAKSTLTISYTNDSDSNGETIELVRLTDTLCSVICPLLDELIFTKVEEDLRRIDEEEAKKAFNNRVYSRMTDLGLRK